MDNEPITVVFTYTRDEYIRAMRRHYRTNVHVYRDVGLSVVMIVTGVAVLYFLPEVNRYFAWIVIALAAVLLLMVGYALFILPALIYRSDPKLRSEYTLRFYDDRIEFKTDNIDSTLQWQLYHSWLRDDEFYILYHGKRNLTIIPRRALNSNGSDEKFTELLQQEIGLPMHI